MRRVKSSSQPPEKTVPNFHGAAANALLNQPPQFLNRLIAQASEEFSLPQRLAHHLAGRRMLARTNNFAQHRSLLHWPWLNSFSQWQAVSCH
jgi:hypothetical protein